MIVEIEGVPLHLAHPDELPVRWVGQDEVMRQLLAAWLVVDPQDLPMNPRLLGKPGVGKRMPIRVTRRLLTAALDGSLSKVEFRTDPYFGLAVPVSVPGVEPHILDPVKTWANKGEFAATAKHLREMFKKNFVNFEKHVDEKVRQAAPVSKIAAE